MEVTVQDLEVLDCDFCEAWAAVVVEGTVSNGKGVGVH